MGVLAATFAMMTVGAALVAIVMAASGEPFDWRPDGIHWLFGIGAGTVIGSILFYHAVTHGPVSLASPVVAATRRLPCRSRSPSAPVPTRSIGARWSPPWRGSGW